MASEKALKEASPVPVEAVLEELAEAWERLALANDAVLAASAAGSRETSRPALRWLARQARDFLRAAEAAVEATTE